jgi:cytochrome c oxidase assembly factor CtaG
VSARRAYGLAGVATVALLGTLDSGSLPAHMAGYALVTCLGAPLLALAFPIGPAHPRAIVAAAIAWIGLVALTWTLHAPALLAAGRTPILGALFHLLLLAAAVAFWLPPLGRGSLQLPAGLRPLYLAAAMPALDGIAILYMAGGRPAAGAAMLAGSTPLAIAAALVAWQAVRAEERSQVEAEATVA